MAYRGGQLLCTQNLGRSPRSEHLRRDSFAGGFGGRSVYNLFTGVGKFYMVVRRDIKDFYSKQIIY